MHTDFGSAWLAAAGGIVIRSLIVLALGGRRARVGRLGGAMLLVTYGVYLFAIFK